MQKIWLEHYQKGVPAEINPDAYSSLAQLFTSICTQYPDRPALSNYGTEFSYQEWLKHSQAFAAYLQQELKLQKGDRIALMMPNTLQYPVAVFGAFLAGLIVVNVNPLYTPDELIHQINDAGVETILVVANFAHVVEKALPKMQLRHVIVSELGDLFPTLKSIVFNAVVKYFKKMIPVWSIPQAINFKKLMQKGHKLTCNTVTLTGDDIAFLQYTGGTTGVAKGVMLTHRNMIANVEQVTAVAKPSLNEAHEIFITPLPLYHIFSLTANLLTCLKLASLNVLITNPKDIPYLIKELSAQPFSAITGVNTLFNALLNNPKFAAVDFSGLKIVLGGGAAVQQIIAERWEKITGKLLLEGYGLTEASPVVSVDPFNLKVFQPTIGLPLPSTDISIRNDANEELLLGEIGELCVKGPQVMKGYWNNPAETGKILSTDGWLRTGDMAYVDPKGFIYIVDRKKDMILVSGFNVYPNEVEEVISSHPGVLEEAVIGVPDEHSGEAVKAFVVKKDPNLTVEALRDYCRQHLTGYKVPRYVEFRESLPKSPVGKILRKELRGK